MSAENLFTTSRIENVNQIIAELYDDSILLEKRMESFFLNLNNIVFFEKANFLFYQKQGQNYKTHSIYTINWNDEQKRRYQEEYCHMDDVLSILDSDSNVTFLTNQLFNQEVRKNSLYFQEFLLPMGLHDSIETNFSIRNRDLRGVFSIHRSNDKKNFLPDELALSGYSSRISATYLKITGGSSTSDGHFMYWKITTASESAVLTIN